jgi:hypothetical protein
MAQYLVTLASYKSILVEAEGEMSAREVAGKIPETEWQEDELLLFVEPYDPEEE